MEPSFYVWKQIIAAESEWKIRSTTIRVESNPFLFSPFLGPPAHVHRPDGGHLRPAAAAAAAHALLSDQHHRPEHSRLELRQRQRIQMRRRRRRHGLRDHRQTVHRRRWRRRIASAAVAAVGDRIAHLVGVVVVLLLGGRFADRRQPAGRQRRLRLAGRLVVVDGRHAHRRRGAVLEHPVRWGKGGAACVTIT